MTEQPESGELLVGSYLRLVEGCELVMYTGCHRIVPTPDSQILLIVQYRVRILR